LKFLSSVCTYLEEGMSENQENIFKLYKNIQYKTGIYDKNLPILKLSEGFDEFIKNGKIIIPSSELEKQLLHE